MIAFDFNSLCREAEQYFYDLISDERQCSIPSNIIDHLEHCQHCSVRIGRLREILLQVEDGIHPDQCSTIAAWLKLHFNFIDMPVNCEIVKPFLPGFLEPSLEIKIPTPITIHLDKCTQCQRDLEIIRDLQLNSKQLCRLSRFFSAKSDNKITCSQAQAFIEAFVSTNFGALSKGILEHLCVCPDCRDITYQQREIVRDKYLDASDGKEPKAFFCEDISASDYFDYVVPYGIDPANDEYAKFRSFFISHSSACPICLNKMQQMHDLIFGIAERANSEIITTYHIEEPAQSESVNDTENIYDGFPIKAQLAASEEKSENRRLTTSFNNVSAKKKPTVNIRPFVKMGFAAAAVILLGSALLLNISPAKAVSLENIYKAIEKIRNVHILSFDPDKNEPAQEQWVSRTFNVNIVKSEKGTVLWDLANKVKKSFASNTGSVETTALSAALIPEIQNTIHGSFGLLPFNSISEVPKDAQFNYLDDNNQNGIEIYELTWHKVSFEGLKVYWKWRVSTFKETNLPQKVEWYMKSDPNGDYILKSTNVASYIDDDELQRIIKGANF